VSYGVETAADVTEAAVRAIPGFGRGLVEEILGWRRDLEAAFSYNPDAPIEPAELQAIERELRDRRERLAETLRRGAADLQALADQARRNRAILRPEVDHARSALIAAASR
jgi:DNA-binding helix-hairpin-helix protein with protein kinase domain